MTDVTDGDRMRAAEMLDKAGIGHDDRAWLLIGYIAATLAEERAKARAPFLALADSAERYAAENSEPGDPLTPLVYMHHIRLAAEESE